MSVWTYIAIAMYFLFLIFVGRYYYNKNANMSEYLLDNRRLNPLVTALSAGASDMSGWMLLGLPGALYATGICSIWIAIGLSIGAWCNYKFLAKRLRIYTEVASDSITIPDFLENRFKDKTKALRIISGLLIMIFFTLYVSSGIIAGGKTFESFFGLSFTTGAIATICIVVFYTFFGGFKAVCITDAFQGTLMFLVLVLIPISAYLALDIPTGSSFVAEMSKFSDHHFDLFYNQSFLGILGLMAWGLGYFGQPHIIVRFMAIRSSKELDQARRIGISWMVLGLVGAVASGMIGYLYFNQKGIPLSDPEKVFLELGKIFFHPFVVGVIISAVLAAIMSTISSQLLVSASSVTKDFIFAFYKKEVSPSTQALSSRLAVVVVAIVASFLAFMSNDTILNVVGNAWAGFGASFGAVLLFSLYSKNMSALSALIGMLVGGITVIVWILSGLSSVVYELLPGFVFSAVAILLVNRYNAVLNKMADEPNSQVISAEFDKMEKRNNE
ncbi:MULTISPECIES: sodium/proline symporter PutP [unclassified Campylobacter]|uniref:sodium/proline symporter PutP n=1 Tax=unclassified Campylobacter TaxID=2593542 RepID=UPI001B53FFBE|nr:MULTISPECIES: sodium/proline symporter PutP [unclassified Campylobacter]MBP5778637.1 sodium/proline symporter PutP [Campylobacter sp.]MDA3055604.1 sodium/proline symporter PutP [Campylobacter sp. CN_NA1]MDA3064706.1 sodium/proline symporter PutP [Campylobacter sp. CN_NE4]MDA3068470.1 sodium/proline symporter PutP [Campylobacter sp. CN_NE3]MDA3082217.1 sodium/proline symporter PutP [Campylobacter sp. CN_EL2]